MKKEEKKSASPESTKQVAKKEEDSNGKNNIGDNYFASVDLSELEVSMQELMKAGVHFGHQKSRKNPRMDEYVFGTKKGISIIDLQKSLPRIKEALEFLDKIKKEGKEILFVGTKPQSIDLIRDAASYVGMPFVVDRWLGGTFTNFKVIRERAKYLVDSLEKLEKGEFEKYTKFEKMKKQEELGKLEVKMGGIKNMKELPGAIFASSIKDDKIAIDEAQKLGIPVVALADTNVDPTEVDYPIPANDDAVSSIKLILSYVCKVLT